MKYVLVTLFLAVLGCNSAQDSQENAVGLTANETTFLTANETCFLFTEGTENQDSTFVSLQLKGDSVVGYMHWQPWQKDGAYGTISAVKSGDVIRGFYDYMIEGSEQQEEVMFKVTNGKLYKATAELEEVLGDKVTLKIKNPATAVYDYEFREINCALFQKF